MSMVLNSPASVTVTVHEADTLPTVKWRVVVSSCLVSRKYLRYRAFARAHRHFNAIYVAFVSRVFITFSQIFIVGLSRLIR